MITNTTFTFSVIARDTQKCQLHGTIDGYSDIERFVQMIDHYYPSESFKLEFQAVTMETTAVPIAWSEITPMFEQHLKSL